MSIFSQWRLKDYVKRITWICGKEQVLIDQVIDRCKSVTTTQMNRLTLDAEFDSLESIWGHLNQFSFGSDAKRFILIYNSQKIENWQPLKSLIGDKEFSDGLRVVFVSTDEHQFRLSKGQYIVDEYNRRIVKDPITFLSKKQYFDLVICNELISEAPKDEKGRYKRSSDFVLWIQGQVNINEDDANYLIQQSGGNLVIIKTVIEKCKLFSARLSRNMINLLCEQSFNEEFSYHLIALEKNQALAALEAMEHKDYSRVIGELDYRLDMLSILHRANRKKWSIRDVVVREGFNGFVVAKYWPHVRHYDYTRVVHCRNILASIDEAYNRNVRNCMDVLVAMW